MKLSTIFTVSFAVVLLLFNATAAAKSQCVGLTKSQCDANPTCSWRKASVNKNGVKTKAHCRALPKQSKSTAKKSSSKKSTKSKKSSEAKKTVKPKKTKKLKKEK